MSGDQILHDLTIAGRCGTGGGAQLLQPYVGWNDAFGHARTRARRGTRHPAGYDLHDGAELWICGGGDSAVAKVCCYGLSQISSHRVDATIRVRKESAHPMDACASWLHSSELFLKLSLALCFVGRVLGSLLGLVEFLQFRGSQTPTHGDHFLVIYARRLPDHIPRCGPLSSSLRDMALHLVVAGCG